MPSMVHLRGQNLVHAINNLEAVPRVNMHKLAHFAPLECHFCCTCDGAKRNHQEIKYRTPAADNPNSTKGLPLARDAVLFRTVQWVWLFELA